MSTVPALPVPTAALPYLRPAVFVSYHHANDQRYYQRFKEHFVESLELVSDYSLKAPINGPDSAYILECIRDQCITASRCTLVLCGRQTRQRPYIDWEIYYSLEQQNGLMAILLPDAPHREEVMPRLLAANVRSGYATCVTWNQLLTAPSHLSRWIADALSRPVQRIALQRPPLMP